MQLCIYHYKPALYHSYNLHQQLLQSHNSFTPQYKSLEKIYNKYKELDFVVLAFPSNDFRQELSTNEEIKDFCEVYELSFPIFAKGKVKGFEKQQVFKYLTEDSNGRIQYTSQVK